MRSSTIATVLFAASALATPALDRRVLVTEKVVVTVTNYVTAGNLPTSTSASSSAGVEVLESPTVKANFKAHSRHKHRTSTSKTFMSKASTSKTVVAIPETTDSASSVEAFIPPPTSSEAATAPETTEAPPAESTPAAVNDDLPKTKVAGLTSEDEVYKGLTLRHHNVHRSNHSAPALEWNQTLADFAKQSAQTCVWAHDL